MEIFKVLTIRKIKIRFTLLWKFTLACRPAGPSAQLSGDEERKSFCVCPNSVTSSGLCRKGKGLMEGDINYNLESIFAWFAWWITEWALLEGFDGTDNEMDHPTREMQGVTKTLSELDLKRVQKAHKAREQEEAKQEDAKKEEAAHRSK